MKRMIKSKKGVAALLVTLAVVGASAFGAYAYFTNTGTTGATTPVQVGTAALTGSFTVALGTTAYNANGTALTPTAIGDPNAVVATVPFTVTNTTEANELLSSYTITLSGSNTLAGHPACARLGLLGQRWRYRYTASRRVTVSSGGTPTLPTTVGSACVGCQLTSNNVWSGSSRSSW